MIPNLLHLVSRKPDAYERSFVKEVRLRRRTPRNRRVERVLLICWGAIILKPAGVLWAFQHYHIPINPLWVILPTFAFAGLCTAVYFLRD